MAFGCLREVLWWEEEEGMMCKVCGPLFLLSFSLFYPPEDQYLRSGTRDSQGIKGEKGPFLARELWCVT